MIDHREIKERVLLVAVSLDESGREDATAEESLTELAELVKTAGAEEVGRVIQNRERIHPGTYVGSGKIQEILELAQELGANGVVCDDELTPAQLRNLENALEMKVMDRTMVILDIFASRASTREGKIQVELAQLRFRATRLVGMRNSLSRLGGGIGTRGPGETQLEVDRRRIHERISKLKRDLEAVVAQRETARSRRLANHIPVCALVGYTNTGKSTLLNRLTGAGVLEEDQLFATLDPTTRNLALPDGQEILLTDTVGFIRKLPHHLIEAFKSTLEEARYADIILHVIDSANPHCYLQMHTVYETLKDLNVGDKPVIAVLNKQDIADPEETVKDLKADRSVRISARTGAGIDQLLAAIEEVLLEQKLLFEETIPYPQAGLVQQIRKCGQLMEEEYTGEGIRVKAYLPKQDYLKMMSRLGWNMR
ncbi:MAG: GTPase HflX [Lachnospiraceae bacterium]|nr:GTPase HflX [Lachnospiraceae bacterium]MBQ9593447.1 GTPase HflX [Lachnospiraceae bacterium]MBR0152341.1 GTPase HflX [Lachnospiraceae bacterium]